MAKAKPVPPTPPTVLVITLANDGTGSLLVRRGAFAHLSQFTYTGLAEIVAAMEHGAVELIAIEQNPPQVPAQSAPSATAVSDAAPDEAEADIPEALDTREEALIPQSAGAEGVSEEPSIAHATDEITAEIEGGTTPQPVLF